MTHDTLTFYARPFLPGMGPSFRFDFTPFSDGTMHADAYIIHGRKSGDRVCIFDSDGYRPGLSATAARRWASDVVGFAVAYVERPAEFDRAAEDAEQVYAPIWRTYGETLSAMLDTEGR